ncbi:MAG TPA: amidohydrolase [Holophaga sp.]|nr:amidohydrolase [Holophaga sp.]
MRRALLAFSLAAAAAAQHAPALRAEFERNRADLEALYKDLHRHPELSFKEARTATRMAELLAAAGFEVGRAGGGVVGVLRNGKGPTVLLRTEMDALPVLEASGVPWASEAKGVMHACGHDVHMAGWLGAARALAARRDLWRGTLLMVAQPAEEIGEGAQAMLKDGLLTRFPRPDFALAVHATADLPAGSVGYAPGWAMASVDSVNITIYGRGGHGAKPDQAVDPVVIAAKTVLALQTAVSREKDPREPAVLTVGSIHGGTKHNIIPEEVRLQITLRSFDPKVQQGLIASIRRIARGEALASGAPREPLVEVDGDTMPAVWNDPALCDRLAAALGRELGPDKVSRLKPDMVSEDFGAFGTAAGVPSVLLRLGAADPRRLKEAQASGTPLPSLHSPAFVPDLEPTLRTGALSLALAALEVLGRP